MTLHSSDITIWIDSIDDLEETLRKIDDLQQRLHIMSPTLTIKVNEPKTLHRRERGITSARE